MKRFTQLLPYDKLLHLNAGAFVYFIFSLFSGVAICFLAVVLVAILKEVFDKYIKKSTFCYMDIIYTILGGILMFIMLWLKI